MKSQVGSSNPDDLELVKAISRDRGWFGLGVVVLIFIISLVTLAYILVSRPTRTVLVGKVVPTPVATPVATSVITPVDTPTKSYTVEIVNGSGVSGAAGAAKQRLQDRDSQAKSSMIAKIDVTNGANQQGVVVSYRSSEISTSDLAGWIGQAWPDAVAKVDDKLSVDVRIILGK